MRGKKMLLLGLIVLLLQRDWSKFKYSQLQLKHTRYCSER